MVLSMTSGYILDLPKEVQLQYLAEGGANVVYRVVLPSFLEVPPSEIECYGDLTPPPTEIKDSLQTRLFRGNLLRLRKDVQFGLPYRDTANNFNTKIRHLFRPEELVDQVLVRLPSDLIPRCNEQLRASERTGKRPSKRHGVYLATNEPFGMLITDMTNFADPTNTVVAELKPKWLIQSPSAPIGARRCRTCALRDMKNAESIGKTAPPLLEPSRSFCPLDLISDKIEDVQRAMRIFKGRSDQIRIARALYHHPTLLNLVALQQTHNDVGLHGPPAHSQEMSLGMTLRDCTVYVKISPDDGPIEVRLGDLDLKIAASGKASYWRSIENRLIQERWYMGENPSQLQTNGECALSRIRI